MEDFLIESQVPLGRVLVSQDYFNFLLISFSLLKNEKYFSKKLLLFFHPFGWVSPFFREAEKLMYTQPKALSILAPFRNNKRHLICFILSMESRSL